MKRRTGIISKTIFLLTILFFTIACLSTNSVPFISTATPYPTNTPFPTYTQAPPTFTPIPQRWTVRIISAVKSLSFGEYFYSEEDESEFVILTIEYSYMGQDTIPFYPGSLVLVYPEGSLYPGWSLNSYSYQAENSAIVNDMYNDAPIITYISPGQTKIEKFGFQMSSDEETHYILVFPEVEPIDFTINTP